MKIWITKDKPHEFSRRGIDSLSVWFMYKPYFVPGGYKGAFGEHDIYYPEWQSIGPMLKGKILRKFGGDVFEDIWKALLHSYRFNPEEDMYAPVLDYYDAAYAWYAWNRSGANKYVVFNPTETNEKLNFIRKQAAMRYACSIVEKECQRWWEWCLEYDVRLELSE